MTWQVKQIIEPDFGCEERPDGYVQKDIVLIQADNGSSREIQAEDQVLLQNNVNEGTILSEETIRRIQS